MKRFTLAHGLVASALLHAALVLLFIIFLAYSTGRDDDTLVVEFEGASSDMQTEEQLKQQNAGGGGGQGSTEQTAVHKIDGPDKLKPDPLDQNAIPQPAKQEEKGGAAAAPAGDPGVAQQQGGEQQQSAQTIQRSAELQMDALRAYVKRLSKKIQGKLIYPKAGKKAGLQGTATVSFKILPDGAINPDSVRVVTSSGKDELDASAMKTVATCAPFPPPPKEITVTMAVTYAPKR